MCGIIGYIGYDDAFIFILKGLLMLQNRGYDSAGICTIFNNKFICNKYASELYTKKISALDKLNNNITNKGNIGIGHTRWATHGAKTDNNAHPHFSMDNKFVLVHNGIIENYEILKKELIDSHNITFKSQTDTEIIVNLISIYYKETNNIEESISKSINRLEGTWGLAIMCIDKPNTLYCTRHGSPILIGLSDNYYIIASEQSGFCGEVNNYICLKDGDIVTIHKENNTVKLNCKNEYKLKQITDKNIQLSPDPYPYWTIKEIYEQYDSSLRATSLGGRILNEDKVKLGGLNEHTKYLETINNIILLGCGTSYHAGMHSLYFFKDLCNFNTVQLFDGADFNCSDIPKSGNTALILLSQSGETKDLYRCIKIGKENNLFLIGIVNVVDSLIAREVNCGCYLNAGREVGVASTKSFTSQVITLAIMAIWFAQIQNVNSIKRITYIKCLRTLPSDIKHTIETFKKYKYCYHLVNKDNLFVLGKGKSESIAKEGALKIKEISYIHAEGYSGSSLKHGPFALLDENFPVILISPDDEHFNHMQNAYNEIISRNAPVLFITTKQNCNIENSIIVPYNEIFNDLLCVIPLQLIAYYLALDKGHNPDLPKNLCKSVTVG